MPHGPEPLTAILVAAVLAIAVGLVCMARKPDSHRDDRHIKRGHPDG